MPDGRTHVKEDEQRHETRIADALKARPVEDRAAVAAETVFRLDDVHVYYSRFLALRGVTLDARRRDQVVHPVQAADQGALAAAGGADEGGDLLLADLEVDPPQGQELAVVDVDVVQPEHCLGGGRRDVVVAVRHVDDPGLALALVLVLAHLGPSLRHGVTTGSCSGSVGRSRPRSWPAAAPAGRCWQPRPPRRRPAGAGWSSRRSAGAGPRPGRGGRWAG